MGVKAVSHKAVGCHYFPPGLRLPSQPQAIDRWKIILLGDRVTYFVNNLLKVVMQLLPRGGSEPTRSRPVDRKSNAIAVAPPPRDGDSRHKWCSVAFFTDQERMIDLAC